MFHALNNTRSLYNCIYSHPCKDIYCSVSRHNLPMTVVDSVEEMKTKKVLSKC